ncbi:MAG TPA: hypothetical protein PK668_18245 [Myxococcota bacterium]|nr:hypothetical protein [Myxococcota bacterium]HRY95905.1 hypothetical protein [Myxococcota bacterium]HSA24113.1 hypothetical protein [Myxococcota bacterium]
MPRAMAWTVLLTLALAGCGGGDNLGREDVEDLPAGDATGSALSGNYDLEFYTTACKGACPLIDMGLYSLSICDVGNTDDATVSVTQTDGRLLIVGPSLLVPRMEGGLDQDGTFLVGGYATQNSGSVEIVTLGEGAIDGQGQMTGSSETHAWGEVNQTRIDCTALFEISGQRSNP